LKWWCLGPEDGSPFADDGRVFSRCEKLERPVVPRNVVGVPLQIVLQTVSDDLGLRQQARGRGKVPAEQVLDERKMRAAEDRPMRRSAIRLGKNAGDAVRDEAVKLGF
jgi:hypothetical protein